jgi:hypothetical protein
LYNTTQDVWTQSSNTIAGAKNDDANGPGLKVNYLCAQNGNVVYPNNGNALFNNRVMVDSHATTVGTITGQSVDPDGGSRDGAKRFAAMHDEICPADEGNNYRYRQDGWFFAMDQFPLKAGTDDVQRSVPLLTLVHTDFGDDTSNDCHLEQEYFTREMGKVRHESYYSKNANCGGDDQALDVKHDALVANP